MDESLLKVFGVEITPWSVIGYGGALLFALRWIVQAHATRKTGAVNVPASFWWLSLSGSALTMTYFCLGRHDPVGVISNVFPMLSALYSLQFHLYRSTQVVQDNLDDPPPC